MVVAGSFWPLQATGGGGVGPERRWVNPWWWRTGFGWGLAGDGWSGHTGEGLVNDKVAGYTTGHLPGDVYLHHQPQTIAHVVKNWVFFFGLYHLLKLVFFLSKVPYMTHFFCLHHLLDMLLVEERECFGILESCGARRLPKTHCQYQFDALLLYLPTQLCNYVSNKINTNKMTIVKPKA
jgi:hypothetical protein